MTIMKRGILRLLCVTILFCFVILQKVGAEQILAIGSQKVEILDDGKLILSYNDTPFLSDFVITTPEGKILFPNRKAQFSKREGMGGIYLEWLQEGLKVRMQLSPETFSWNWESQAKVQANLSVKDASVNAKPIETRNINNQKKEEQLSFDRSFPDSDRIGLRELKFFNEREPLLAIASEGAPFSFKDFRRNKGFLNCWSISTDTPTEKGEFVISFGAGRKLSFIPLDISQQSNMGFSDSQANDGIGGWTDDGSGNDLKNFPTGTKVFNNIPFQIIDPAANQGKSCIVLKGKEVHGYNFPSIVSVPTKPIFARTAYVLHGAAWTPIVYKGPLAIYRFIYQDGTADEFEVNNNRDIIDWWFAPQKEKMDNFTLAWEGTSGERWVGLGISVFRLTKPDQPVVKVEFSKSAVPGDIVAIPGIVGLVFSEADIAVISTPKTVLVPSVPSLDVRIYGLGNIGDKLDEELNLDGLKVETFSGLTVDKTPQVVMIGTNLSSSYGKSLVEFVQNGGGLFLALPPENNFTLSLREILPVELTGGKTEKVAKDMLVRPEVVEADHPAIKDIDWEPYPGSPFYYRVKEKQGAKTLIRWTDGSPALVVGQFGKGRIAYFAGPIRIEFGQIYLGSEFQDYRLFFLKLAYWLAGNDEFASTLGFLGKAERLRDNFTERLASIRSSSEDLMQVSNLAKDTVSAEAADATVKWFYSLLEQADKLLASARFREACNAYRSAIEETFKVEEEGKLALAKLKERLVEEGFKEIFVKEGLPVEWGQHGILQYSNTEWTDDSAIREYTIGVYLDYLKKLGMNSFVQGGGTNRFIKKGADPTVVDLGDLQLNIYDDYIRAAKAHGFTFFIHADGRETIHDNFDGNYDYFHEGFVDKLPYPEKRGRAVGAEEHPFDRYNAQVLKRYNQVLRLIAKHYADEPTVVGYDTDNETHNLYWQTEEARAEFRKRLLEKYNNLDRINKTLGFNFSKIEEIIPPSEKEINEEGRASSPKKALWYEWKDFENWVSVRYFQQYQDAVKGESPEKRLMDRYSPNNAIGNATYSPYGDVPYDEIAAVHDVTGLHIGRDYNLDYMSGYAGKAALGLSEYYPFVWDGPYNATFRLKPGLGGQWAVPEMAGEIDNYASCVRNFWLVFSRDVRVIHDHAMGNGNYFLPNELSHSNPYGFGYFRYGIYGMKYVHLTYQKLRGETDGSVPYLPIAIMDPNESRIQAISSPIIQDVELLPRESNSIYSNLCRPLYLTPDLIPSGKDISGYEVVIVPYALYLKKETQVKLEEYVRNGGVLVVSGPVGIYDELSRPSGHLLKEIWKVENPQRQKLPNGQTRFNDGFKMSLPGVIYGWVFGEPTDSSVQVKARYSDGKPAVLESAYGKGRAFLLGYPFKASGSQVELLQRVVTPFVSEIFQCQQKEVYLYPRRKGNDLILYMVNRLAARQRVSVELVKKSPIADLRLGISWTGKEIACDLLPGEGRVFKVQAYFPLR